MKIEVKNQDELNAAIAEYGSDLIAVIRDTFDGDIVINEDKMVGNITVYGTVDGSIYVSSNGKVGSIYVYDTGKVGRIYVSSNGKVGSIYVYDTGKVGNITVYGTVTGRSQKRNQTHC